MKAKNKLKPVVIVMGSDSDWPCMKEAANALDELGVDWEAHVVSAHRTPKEMVEFAESAADRGAKVIIAGAGGAAHLPGMVASLTVLPVIGVPVPIGSLQGEDALLSIVQMPKGVPVACMAIGGAWNAGVLAAEVLGTQDAKLQKRVLRYKEGLREKVLRKKLSTKE